MKSRRVAILAGILALGGLLALSEGLHGQILAALEVIGSLFARRPVLGAFLFVGLSALSAVLVFFSGVLLVPAGMQTWGEVGCFLLLWCGWFLGGVVTYCTGRFLGRPAVRWMLSDRVIARYEGLIPRAGSISKATLIQLALPSDITGYFFGLLGYRANVYLVALALAELPYALGTVYLGSAFIQRQYELLLSAAVVAGAVFGLAAWHRRRRR